MIGRNIFALACLGAFTSASKRFWSPYTWMRDQEDRHLAVSIKDFFTVLNKEEENADEETGEDASEDASEDATPMIEKLDGNRVRILEDTLLSDYIQVNYWMWEPIVCDPEHPDMPCDTQEEDKKTEGDED